MKKISKKSQKKSSKKSPKKFSKNAQKKMVERKLIHIFQIL